MDQHLDTDQTLELHVKDGFIQSLSSENLSWFVDAIQGMILADRRVDEHELSFLREIISLLSDKEQAERLVAMIRERKQAELDYAGQMNRDIAFDILTILVKVALADSKLSSAEAVFFKQACRRLGYDNAFSRDMLVWAQKKLELESEYKRLKTVSGAIKDNFKRGPQTVLDAKQDLLDKGKRMEEKTLTAKNSSLRGKYVDCLVCKQPEIPFWILRKKSMRTQANIFGVSVYTSPVGDKDFCDYNLMQVAVCPKCCFASNDIHYFKGDDEMAEGFEPEKFAKEWLTTLPVRQKKRPDDLKSLNAEERSVEMSILSYDYAIMTFELLHKMDKQHESQLKIVGLQMIQAELLMNAGKRDAAEANLKKSAESLDSVFSYLEGESIFRSAALLCLIKMYFKDYAAVGQYMGFLKNYSSKEELDKTSMEYKVFTIANNRVDAAYSERESYGFDKLKSFHLS
ncbi:MAG: TerB family tellurite resistance protein [SAR324 cluster bacterium]|nr:TerB family tellurite resistance protein [SAR324 cluster bacterium]